MDMIIYFIAGWQVGTWIVKIWHFVWENRDGNCGRHPVLKEFMDHIKHTKPPVTGE
jgi:hypothetical protein